MQVDWPNLDEAENSHDEWQAQLEQQQYEAFQAYLEKQKQQGVVKT